MVHYLPERPGSPNNAVAPTYLLIASRLKKTHGASRGGVYLASPERLGNYEGCVTQIWSFRLDLTDTRAQRGVQVRVWVCYLRCSRKGLDGLVETTKSHLNGRIKGNWIKGRDSNAPPPFFFFLKKSWWKVGFTLDKSVPKGYAEPLWNGFY